MTRMSASEAFVETLVAHGVKHVFGIVGSAYMDALDLFEPAGIRFIPVAHEQGAGHMADGYSRVSGQKACDAQKRGKTTVLEVRVTQELGDPFRRDALKKPVRVLDKYKAYTVA